MDEEKMTGKELTLKKCLRTSFAFDWPPDGMTISIALPADFKPLLLQRLELPSD
jgi:hypothetical protein